MLEEVNYEIPLIIMVLTITFFLFFKRMFIKVNIEVI